MLASIFTVRRGVPSRHDETTLRCLVSKLQGRDAGNFLRQMPVFPVDSVGALG